MKIRSIKQLAVVGVLAAGLVACADSATAPTMSPKVGAPSFAAWPGTIVKFNLADLNSNLWEEKFIVCKDFTGSLLSYPAANFSATITPSGGAAYDAVAFSLNDGQCADFGFYGGAGIDFSVTETAITNYTTSYQTGTVTKQVGLPSVWSGFGSSTSGYTATGSAYGDRGSATAVGTYVLFTNNYVPPSGCTYTIGYWKTHSENGPAPYDDTWAQLANGASTTFFLSGTTWYNVFWTAPAGNAYYQLAHQYMGAKLNVLNGASVPSNVATAISDAETLFNTYTPAQIGALAGSSNLRKQFVALAGTLGSYNEGLIGPGHCGE